MFAALAGEGWCGVWRKGKEEGHFYILLRMSCFSAMCGVPTFIFDYHSTPYAHFVAEPGDKFGVAAWEADAQDWSCWRVGEGDGEIAKGREGTEIGEDDAEVLDRAGEVGC